MKTYNSLDSKSLSTKYILRCPFKIQGKCQSRIIALESPTSISKYQAILKSPHEEFKFLSIKEGESNEIGYFESDDESTHHSQLFYKFASMWDFDNIGVSRPVSTMDTLITLTTNADDKDKEHQTPIHIQFSRFLTCADCDRGPLGFSGFVINDVDSWEANGRKVAVEKPEDMVYFFCIDSCIYE
ncbi:hypothetical protein CANARDRAFT_22573 [[Candida] arabinofermentans NRRL YB-2248]|uniref:Uncharacterized protein n=1 Tax=[Candida] arabinofermentans NRRL YB-2248 TaxID=983967 RepID=A0A1E4T231_9ASCO|nr:hypothetical protein CANARDRAFT_22573 [[Candida] arabinofermentans NRRL YB-2248]